MNVYAVAAVWLAGGFAGTVLVRTLRLKLLAVVSPLTGAAGTVFAAVGPHSSPALASGMLSLDRAGQGLLVAAAGSFTLAILLARRLDGSEAATCGLVGAATVFALAASSPVLWAIVLLAGIGALAVRWIAVAPSRASLAAGRIPTAGAAALLGAAPFLPVVGLITGPRPEIAAGLLAGGVVALLALVPLGGWATGVLASLRGIEMAPWLLFLAPAVLLIAERVPAATTAAGDSFGKVLLSAGLASAVWGGLQGLMAEPRLRYGRLFLADLGLSAAAIGTDHPAPALAGGFLILLTHLTLAPVLLQRAGGAWEGSQRLAWIALSGLPPAPSFWARFLLLQALVQVGSLELLASLLAFGLMFFVSVRGAFAPGPAGSERRQALEPAQTLRQALVWLAVGAAFAIGAAPGAAISAVFGG